MEGNVDHASDHMHPSLDPAKPKHSQFNFTDKKKFADILAEAWKKRPLSKKFSAKNIL